MHQISTVHTYFLKERNTPLKLSIGIGYGQPSLTSLFINGKSISPRLIDSISDFNIGNSDELRGKSLLINTIVHDLQPITDYTSFKFRLKGGRKVLSPIIQKQKVDKSGGVVIYSAYVIFI